MWKFKVFSTTQILCETNFIQFFRYLHMWAWLIMDYVTKKDENGHWKCLLASNMYICGTLKERELILCFIPRPILKCLNFMFGSRNNSDENHGTSSSSTSSCSRCSLICSVFFVPLAFALGLIAVTVLLAFIIAFLPVFIVFILPCIGKF